MHQMSWQSVQSMGTLLVCCAVCSYCVLCRRDYLQRPSHLTSLTAYVFFCQTFAMSDRIYFPGSLSTMFSFCDSSQLLLLLARTLSGVWNLDFGRYIFPPLCVSDGINTYHALFFD